MFLKPKKFVRLWQGVIIREKYFLNLNMMFAFCGSSGVKQAPTSEWFDSTNMYSNWYECIVYITAVRTVTFLTLYVPCIMLPCVDKQTRHNTRWFIYISVTLLLCIHHLGSGYFRYDRTKPSTVRAVLERL
jgi:hypothetical protein